MHSKHQPVAVDTDFLRAKFQVFAGIVTYVAKIIVHVVHENKNGDKHNGKADYVDVNEGGRHCLVIGEACCMCGHDTCGCNRGT